MAPSERRETMYSLYCSSEHEGLFFTECFDILNEPQLLQLRERSFQGEKKETNKQNKQQTQNQTQTSLPTLPRLYQCTEGNRSSIHPAAALTEP